MIQQTDLAGRAARLITALQQYDLIVKGVRGQRSAPAKLLLELGSPPASHEGALSEPEAEAECYALHQQNNDDFGYKQVIDYLSKLRLPEEATPTQRQEIKRKSKTLYSYWRNPIQSRSRRDLTKGSRKRRNTNYSGIVPLSQHRIEYFPTMFQILL
jgi:hypothetical protein